MQIAVCVNCFHCIACCERETDLRLFARFQVLALCAVLRRQTDPFDEVFLQHRVLYTADCNLDLIAFYAVYRHVLLHCRIYRTRH